MSRQHFGSHVQWTVKLQQVNFAPLILVCFGDIRRCTVFLFLDLTGLIGREYLQALLSDLVTEIISSEDLDFEIQSKYAYNSITFIVDSRC